MPSNVFGNSSNNSDNKIDTSLFVRKTYLKSNYIEADMEEDIDLKNQYRIKNLPNTISISEAASKNYVDNLFNDPSVVKNNAHIELNDRNITNARFIQVNQLPQIDSHLTAKLYVDTQIDQQSIVRNNQDNNFNNNKLTIINSITINTTPTHNNHVTNKKYIDDELDKDTIIRLNDDSNDRYLKVNINNTIYNLQIYKKLVLTDTTIMKFPNNGDSLLQNWRLSSNDRNNNGNVQNFFRSTKTSSPTSNSGAINSPPIGDSFMYIETSSNNFGPNVFCSWERVDIIQISNITFYYNRFSIQGDFRAMGCFQIQILTKNNVWITKFNIAKIDQFSNAATDWIILNLNITDENYGVKFVYDQIDSAHADMCFSIITITHSPY